MFFVVIYSFLKFINIILIYHPMDKKLMRPGLHQPTASNGLVIVSLRTTVT